MCPGLAKGASTDCPQLRTSFLVARELSRLNVDIAALQETRLLESGSVREDGYTFFWKGRGSGESMIHGVGFAVSDRLLKSITTPVGINERLMTLKVQLGSSSVTVISAYAPTLGAEAERKDEFYEELRKLLRDVPKGETVYLLGDFNARVGANHENWPICLGHYGVGKVNDNGHRLLELCTELKLVITNSFFRLNERQYVTWQHPRSRHWHQLDFVITRKEDLNSVKRTRAFHSADCGSDHALVISEVKFPKRGRAPRRGPKPAPKVDVSDSTAPDKVLKFGLEFVGRLNASKSADDGCV